jgi:cation diffusion facilitator family transporter
MSSTADTLYRTAPAAEHPRRPTLATCSRCALNYASQSLSINAALGVLKVVVGLLSGSRALVASALYSINDVLSGLTVLVSVRVARRNPDRSFPFGYGQAEYIAIGLVSAFITAGVIFLFTYSVIDILRGVHHTIHLIALPVAGVALATNHYLAKKGHCISKQTRSPMVETVTHHNHADAEGSFLTIIALSAAAGGFYVVDQIVAILETLHIVWLAGSLFGHSLRGLMDTAISPSAVELIRQTCCDISGVEEVVALRSRQSGSFALIDVEVRVADDLEVEKAGQICLDVKEALATRLPFATRCQVKFSGGSDASGMPTMEAEGVA